MQTIGHRSGGYIQLSNFGRGETIRAQYRDESKECATLPAARGWLTKKHRAAVAARGAEHHAACFGGAANA